MVDRGLTHVALPVSNLNASIAFYTTYARMQVVHRRTVPTTGFEVAWLSDKTRPSPRANAHNRSTSSRLSQATPRWAGESGGSRSVVRVGSWGRAAPQRPARRWSSHRVFSLHPRPRRPYPGGIVWPGSRADGSAGHLTPRRRTRHAAPLCFVRSAPEH